MKAITNVIGFDDAPFSRSFRGDVLLVGCVFSKTRLDGVLSSHVRRDGANSTARMIAMISESPFERHIKAVLLQGIAVAGFNVVDVAALHRALGRPVLVVTRRPPDLPAMRRALEARVPGWKRKWALIERAGALEAVSGVLVQRAGISLEQAGAMIEATTLHGNLPEALRVAHLIAGGVTTGTSRGRA
jgi:endonuclease V-like protein UPF0215 family